MYKKYTVDVSKPAATLDELAQVLNSNRSSRFFQGLQAFTMVGVMSGAALMQYYPKSVAPFFFLACLIVFLYMGYLGDYRRGAMNQLKPISTEQSYELLDFLETAENPDVLRYVEEVRKMGRPFTQQEFNKLKEHEARMATSAIEKRASELLYGVNG